MDGKRWDGREDRGRKWQGEVKEEGRVGGNGIAWPPFKTYRVATAWAP